MSEISVHVIKDGVKESFNLNATSVREALSLLKLQKDQDYIDDIVNNKFVYLVGNDGDDASFSALNADVIDADISGNDTLIIIKEISGATGIEIGLMIGWALTDIGLATVGAFVLGNAALIGTIAMVGISFGVSAIMSALSPTPEFSNDPAAKQNSSNLFNGAPIIRNQGGSVPLVFGNPYCGAVLISSGAFTEEATI